MKSQCSETRSCRCQLLPELSNGVPDNATGPHRRIDLRDPLGGVNLEQVELALQEARWHEVLAFAGPPPHPLGDHLCRRLQAHELHPAGSVLPRLVAPVGRPEDLPVLELQRRAADGHVLTLVQSVADGVPE